MQYRNLILVSSLSLLPCLVQGKRALLEDYTGAQFYQKMDFFDQADPTNGHVKYLDMTTANDTSLAGLIGTNETDSAVFLGTDYTNITAAGRPSIRVSSNRTYDSGLFIADIAHMPGGVCGTWPAFWLLGTAAPWPDAGEVDIIEGINMQTSNMMALHVSGSFEVNNDTDSMTGSLQSTDGDVNSPLQPHNKGAVASAPSDNTFGVGFNAANGGVYATEVSLEANRIAIWFFPRGSIPMDIQAGDPQPFTWGTPTANFVGSALDFQSKFKTLQIIINLTFCGEWAGKPEIWGESECSQLAPTCNEYVSNHPEVYRDMYWAVNSLRVYEAGGQNETTVTNSPTVSPTPCASAAMTGDEARPSSGPLGSATKPQNGTFGHGTYGMQVGAPENERPRGGGKIRRSRIHIDEDTEPGVAVA